MSTTPDPKAMFEKWFGRQLEILDAKFEKGDGAIAALMIALPLYEWYLVSKVGKQVAAVAWPGYDLVQTEMGLPDRKTAKKFWHVFRHGLCHTEMPFESSNEFSALSKVSFHHTYPKLPDLRTTRSGDEVFCVDPWGIVAHVTKKYQDDPSILTSLADAPLLAVNLVSPGEVAAPV